MGLKYEERYATHPSDAKNYDTNRLRDEYLVQNIMEEGNVNLTYSQYDRLIVGGAVPVNEALKLESIDPLKAEYFLERRELGIVNVGGKGSVSVDDEVYELDYKEALYVGKGKRKFCLAVRMLKILLIST